jgi:autoinducer 2 (AI-2) kinase
VAGSVANASTTGLLDLATRRPVPARAGDPIGAWRERVGPVAEAGSVIGVVGHAAAGRVGLAAGTPLVAGGGDAQLAALGLAQLEPGDTATIMGTHWQQTVTLDVPGTDVAARFRTIAHAPTDRWQADAIAWSAGRFLDWVVELVGGADGSAAGRDHAFAELESAAARLEPGAGGVLAVAGLPMSGAVWGHAAPTLTGFTLDDGRAARAGAFRAVIEAGCLVAAEHLRIIGAAVRPDDREADERRPIRVGGGASRSDLVCQVLADVAGRPVERAAATESSVLGGAICAWTGVGVFPDVASGAQRVARVERRFTPEPDTVAAYRDVARRWAAAAGAARDLAAAGITEPVWRPAH